jgi:TolA-binding protein
MSGTRSAVIDLNQNSTEISEPVELASLPAVHFISEGPTEPTLPDKGGRGEQKFNQSPDTPPVQATQTPALRAMEVLGDEARRARQLQNKRNERSGRGEQKEVPRPLQYEFDVKAEAAEMFNSGREFYTKKEYASAISEFEALIKLHPGQAALIARANEALSYCYELHGNDLIEAASKAHGSNPKEAEKLFAAAEALLTRLEKLQGGSKQVARLSENLADYTEKHESDKSKLEPCINYLIKAVEAYGNDSESVYARLSLGRLQHMMGNTQKASEVFTAFLSTFPKHENVTDAAQGLARCHWDRGDYQKAFDTYQMLSDSNNTTTASTGRFFQAQCALRLGRTKDAITLLNLVASTKESTYSEAAAKLSGSLQKTETEKQINASYSAVYQAFKAGEHDKVIKLAGEHVKQFPGSQFNVEVKHLEAVSEVAQGKPDSALIIFTELLKNNPQHSLKDYWAGQLKSIGEKKAFEAAKGTEAHYQKALTLLTSETPDFAAAESEFIKFIEAHPKYPHLEHAIYNLAFAQFKQGKYSEAEQTTIGLLKSNDAETRIKAVELAEFTSYYKAKSLELDKGQSAALLTHARTYPNGTFTSQIYITFGNEMLNQAQSEQSSKNPELRIKLLNDAVTFWSSAATTLKKRNEADSVKVLKEVEAAISSAQLEVGTIREKIKANAILIEGEKLAGAGEYDKAIAFYQAQITNPGAPTSGSFGAKVHLAVGELLLKQKKYREAAVQLTAVATITIPENASTDFKQELGRTQIKAAFALGEALTKYGRPQDAKPYYEAINNSPYSTKAEKAQAVRLSDELD